MAPVRDAPHISSVGRRLVHTAGRSGWPNSAHLMSGSSCTQGIPAGFPWGMPGIGDEMLGAMQQAPQFGRQSMQFLNHGLHG
jgi:hypothetical protein